MKPIDTRAPAARAAWVVPAVSRLKSVAAEQGTRDMGGDGAFTQS